MPLIRTLSTNREVTAILENAYGIGYEKQSNSIWTASFSLPLDDQKVKKVELLKYVEITDGDEYIGLFRIIPKRTRKNSQANYVQFDCEHVLATLLDSSLFQYHQLSNYTTTEVLTFLINRQRHKHWKLGRIDFTRYFHYSWENENLLSALFSVPKPFNEQFRWEWDTKSYPWTLNLVKPSMEPICRIKEGYNLQTLEVEENPMGVYNRIYPLGAGEGVNQLTISKINGGLPYLEDRAAGEEIREYIWVDKRFTDAETLKSSAQALLDRWKRPLVTWSADAADVSSITGLSVDKLKEGAVVRLDVDGFPRTDLRIMRESRRDIKGDPGNVQLEIGNVQEDLSTTNADLERRQQVNELYSQGATNIDSRDFADNCDARYPAILRMWIPDDVVNINEMTLTFETVPYRAYERAIKGGGAIVSSTAAGGAVVKSTSSGGGVVKSTSSGGGSTQTSSSGGGSTQTSSSGGGVSKSTASGGNTVTSSDNNVRTEEITGTGVMHPDGSSDLDHFHYYYIMPHSHRVSIPAHTHGFEVPNHTHTVNTPSHTHSVTIPAHTHDITVPDHTHSIDIPAHTHQITLPDHTHDIEYGIFEYDKMPSRVTVKVDGNTVPTSGTSGDRIDIIPFLAKDSEGKISRGRYAEIVLTPNDLARINATVTSRLFIQSQIGGKF